MSLKKLQRQELTKTLEKYGCNFRHLIVDDTTSLIVKSLFKDDILNYVYTCYKIDDSKRSKGREKGIYLLDPFCIYSIDCLLADFSRGLRYKDAVLLLLPGISTENLRRIRSNQLLMQSIRGRIINVDYLSLRPLENRVFVTDATCSVPVYYNYQRLGRDLQRYQQEKALQSMMSLCILTHEYPIVRYFNSPLSKSLALEFQRRLDEYYRAHSELAPTNSRTVFLITERAMDIFGPFCHYKYYRSQIFDLMDDKMRKIRKDYTFVYDYDVKTGEGIERKHLAFDSDDPVYTKLKDLKIEDYTKQIVGMVNTLRKEDEQYSNLKYTSDLSHAALSQGEHMFGKQLITGHFNLITQINDRFQADKILDAIVFENKCASNLGPDRSLHEPITSELLTLLADDSIFMGNKIRLLIVYAIYRGGLIKSDFVKLLKFSIPEKADSILTLISNLEKLQVFLFRSDLRSKMKPISTYFDIKNTEELTERLVPTFSNIISRLARNELPEVYNTMTTDNGYNSEDYDNASEDDKTFPYVKGAPIDTLSDSLQGMHLGNRGMNSTSSFKTVRSQPKWKSVNASDNTLTKQKLFIFCAGGLTESELSTMISLEPKLNRNIFIGADEVYSTWDLLGDIRLINDDRKNFDFVLDKKSIPRKPPAILYENSAGSSSHVSQTRAPITNDRRQQQQLQQQRQYDISNTSRPDSGESGNSSHHHHHHHLHHYGSTLSIGSKEHKKSGLLHKWKKFGKN